MNSFMVKETPKNLITFSVDYNILSRTDNNRILLTDTRRNIKYRIVFYDNKDIKWSGRDKIVVFTTLDGYSVTQIYSDEITTQFIPTAMLDETCFSVSVYSLGDEKITTNPVFIEFKKSGYRKSVDTGLLNFNQVDGSPYLCMAEYAALDYDYAYEYFEQYDIPVPDGACSAVYNNNIMGRNLDWFYSEMVDCIIRTGDTLGVAGANTKFTRDFVESREYNELYRILPFYLQDGINSAGLCCATLVTPNIVGCSVPLDSVKESVNSIMLVRYILDKFNSLNEAIDYLKYYVKIIFHPRLCEMGYNQHWILSQNNDCVIIEVNETGELKTINYAGKTCAVTNFHLNGVELNTDGTVYTPTTQTSTEDAITTNHVKTYGSGLERFNLIQTSPSNTIDDMKTLIKELRYSKIYDINTEWYTDFVDEKEELTCNTSKEIYMNIVERYSRIYPMRSRTQGSAGFGFWNTNHSSIYDLSNKKLIVCSQEDYGLDNTKWYDYTL